MGTHIDFSKLTTSWTKYDIVQVLDVVYSVDTIIKYKNKEAKINEPILRSFLGIESLDEPIPSYWIEIQKYPNEKQVFSLLALIFTHGGVVNEFAEKYSTGDMKGVFYIDDPGNKQQTNIRSALVESRASEPFYRRKEKVPYDFSVAFYNPEVGKLFKQVLQERVYRVAKKKITDKEFYQICEENNFYKALSLTKEQFISWLEGETFEAHYIKRVIIEKFYSIKERIELNFEDSKEIYFLGENGDGKSLLLMALYLSFNGNFIKNQTDKKDTGNAFDMLDEIGVLGYDEFNHEYNLQNAIYLNHFFAYGTHRGRESSEKYEKYGFMTLFSSELTLHSPVQWIKDLKLKEEDNSKTNIAINVLNDVLFELLERNVKLHIGGSDVLFEEKGSMLTLDQLSEGYRSIIIFVCDLIYRLSIKNDPDSNILESKGVVLVDEIDQHLHLKWQRKIVSKLRTIFPNIQFFFTTHSPTMIQGASNDAMIFRIYRDCGITKISEAYYRKELDHLMMNTLVTSSLFGLEDSRLNPINKDSNTDDSYVIYKLNEKIANLLKEQKAKGKNFISEQEIDNIIDSILKRHIDDKS